jgi:ArsR family transcriptional regulator, arsenate/arsenite/antimonite-responsive transcriptional repressor
MQNLIEIFKTLSDETRLRILKLLEHGELCVCGIVAALDMIQPKVSFHLGVLKEGKFITDRRQGKWIYYRIDNSDLFRRFLVLSILEKISEDTVSDDKKRLQNFAAYKKTHETNHAISERRAEC